jgi:hypothetical protein
MTSLHPNCTGKSRRTFLSDTGMGFTGLVLAAMLQRDGIVKADSPAEWSPPDGMPHFAPKAKSVIWLFMLGGASHLETFDPKPACTKYAGQTIAETPFKSALESPLTEMNKREVAVPDRTIRTKLYPLQVGFQKYGESGIEVSDWLPNIGSRVDDLCVVRSMWTTDTDHGAVMQMHTGRHMLDGYPPSIGSWVHYGLGSLNENLPQFVVLGTPLADNSLPSQLADYLGPEHDGVNLTAHPKNAMPFATPGLGVAKQEHARQIELLRELNQINGVQYPHDPKTRARIKSYELAFRMQMAVPDIFRFHQETNATRKLYGLDDKITSPFGTLCLSARRLVEQGTRFVQVYHGGGNAIQWDAHSNLQANHSKLGKQIDVPVAGLLKDLKQRGLLDETLVVWTTEFGRSPGIDRGNGRDHHPWAISIWMAGGGIKGGQVHGATDEIGFHAVENRHYVTDLHATILHQLGLDPRKLDFPGQKRLKIDYGHPIHEIIA